MALTSQQIVDNLLNSCDLLISNKLRDLSFDKTVVCTIVDNSDKEKGQYIVSNNSIQFNAFCENPNYRIGDSVCVLIPKGDFSSPQKTILSKYNYGIEDQPIFYTPPFQQLILSKDIINKTDTFSIMANGEDKESQPILEKKIYTLSGYEENSLMFSSIGVCADFKCTLQNYNITSGEYGLRFVLKGKNPKEIFEARLSSSEMFGNPFGFIVPLKQEKKIDILNLSFKVNTIEVYLYQDGKFYEGKEKISMSPFGDNIEVKNIELYFAQDTSIKSKNSCEIIADQNTYSLEDKTRTVALVWYRTNDDNKYISFPDDDYEIIWSRFASGKWEVLNTKEDRTTLDKEKENIKKVEIILNEKIKEEKIKAIIKYKEKYYESNILIFTNTSFSEDLLTQTQDSTLFIELGEQARSAYPFYGKNNQLIDLTQSTINRQLKLGLRQNSLNIGLKDFSEIVWYIPKENTMLSFDKKFLEDKGFILQEDEKLFYKFVIKDKNTQDKPFYFKIKENFNNSYVNNIIKCQATYANISYIASFSFIFSSYGNNNTNYTPIIVQSKTASKSNSSEKINFTLEASLYGPNYEFIPLKVENVKWETLNLNGEWVAISQDSINSNSPKISIDWDINNTNIYRVNISLDLIQTSAIAAVNYINEKYLQTGSYISAPTKITYSKNGEPEYYKGELKLFDENNIQIKNSNQLNKIKASSGDIKWSLKYYSEKDVFQEEFLPKIIENKIPNSDNIYYIFQAPNMLIKNSLSFSLIVSFMDQNKVEQILWVQPIIISSNEDNLSLLDQDKPIILNKDESISNVVVGSGKTDTKDKQNFSSIFLGDLKEISADKKTFGLYGYYNNNQFFKVNIDGEIKIGDWFVKDGIAYALDNNKDVNSDIYFSTGKEEKDIIHIQSLNQSDEILESFKVDSKGKVAIKNCIIEDSLTYQTFPIELTSVFDETASLTITCQAGGKDFTTGEAKTPVTVSIPYTIKKYKFLGTPLVKEENQNETQQ